MIKPQIIQKAQNQSRRKFKKKKSRRISPFGIAPVKKTHIRLGHPGIVDHSVDLSIGKTTTKYSKNKQNHEVTQLQQQNYTYMCTSKQNSFSTFVNEIFKDQAKPWSDRTEHITKLLVHVHFETNVIFNIRKQSQIIVEEAFGFCSASVSTTKKTIVFVVQFSICVLEMTHVSRQTNIQNTKHNYFPQISIQSCHQGTPL